MNQRIEAGSRRVSSPFHALNCASKLTVVSRFGRNGVIVLGRIVHPASFLVAPRPSECYWAVGWDASVDGQVPWVWLSQYTVPVMRYEHAILTQDGTRRAEQDFLLLGSRAQGDFTRARCVLKLRFGPSCAGANLKSPRGSRVLESASQIRKGEREACGAWKCRGRKRSIGRFEICFDQARGSSRERPTDDDVSNAPTGSSIGGRECRHPDVQRLFPALWMMSTPHSEPSLHLACAVGGQTDTVRTRRQLEQSPRRSAHIEDDRTV